MCVEEVEGRVASLPCPHPTGSLVSQLPSLNFVIYLPKRTEYPLHIRQDQRSNVTPTNAFLVPQWGGVVVYNPPEMGSGQDMELQREAVAQDKLNVSVRMEELMPLIIGQLKMLLGVPVHVSRRSYICHKTIFGRPFFNQCWSKWSTSSFKFSSFASNLVSPSLSLSLSLSHPCPCGTLHLVC